MKLFNTLTRKIEEFKPINPPHVNMFVCGPTVYDFAHIGNAKTYTQFDFIVRYLRFRAYDVNYIMNITNIDDKIIKRAKEQGISWDQLSKKYEDIFLEDMQTMHNTAVSHYARATDFIDQIVTQVKTLMDKGYGYKTSDGIYFDIKKFKGYGKLSGRTEADQNAGVSRIDESLNKKNKNDFCLWKKSKTGEPFWETELGKGRPGWHIEDTAITEKLLGQQYDVHGGAIDLIFPHHEAEIAQMEAASGKSPLVRYWLHGAFLNVNEVKMSKSKGNFTTMREAKKKYGYRLLRFFIITNHYRTTLEWGEASLEQSRNGLQRLDDFILNLDKNFDDDSLAVSNLKKEVIGYLDNDFDTPKAMAALYSFIRGFKGGKNILALFKELNTFFDFFIFEKVIPAEIKKLTEERDKARESKDFKRADEIRDIIKNKGFEVNDTKVS